MSATMTLAEVRAAMAAVVAEHPGWQNPTTPDGSACLYTDDQGRHCLVGQLAASLGWTVPTPADDMNASSMVRTYEWPVDGDAAAWLDEIQIQADESGAPWAKVWDEAGE